MYDIIGDIHGCHDELLNLVEKLGYNLSGGMPTHPEGRRVISVGDLCDRGPQSDKVLDFFMKACEDGDWLCVLGNHDDKLRRYLKGNKIKVNNGLQGTIDQLMRTQKFGKSNRKRVDLDRLRSWLDSLPTQLMLDDDKLLVAHAGLKEKYHGVSNKKTRAKALYGETTGEKDEHGYPVRKDWASKYSGVRVVVHGHVRGDEVRIKNNVYNLDTSCVYGGQLTALRYPEMEIVSVDAVDTYWERTKKSGLGTCPGVV